MSFIDKLLGRQPERLDFKDAITFGTQKLSSLNLQIDKCEDSGMHKYALLTGGNFNLTFYYDRGIIECYIEYKNKFKFDVVQLANFLNAKKNIYDLPDYKKEILEVTKEYSCILENEFPKIDKYLTTSTDKELKESEEYCVTEASKLWSTKFSFD